MLPSVLPGTAADLQRAGGERCNDVSGGERVRMVVSIRFPFMLQAMMELTRAHPLNAAFQTPFHRSSGFRRGRTLST